MDEDRLIQFDDALEKLSQQFACLERRLQEQEKDFGILIATSLELSNCTAQLAKRVKAFEQQMLEINLLMGLMPGDDARIH